VKVDFACKKYHADEKGGESEVPLDDWIDVGVLGEDGTPLFLEKRHIEGPEGSFEAVVDQQPAKAGIDPLNKLIDRVVNDNVIKVEAGGDAS